MDERDACTTNLSPPLYRLRTYGTINHSSDWFCVPRRYPTFGKGQIGELDLPAYDTWVRSGENKNSCGGVWTLFCLCLHK
jgi:hypothetical protein